MGKITPFPRRYLDEFLHAIPDFTFFREKRCKKAAFDGEKLIIPISVERRNERNQIKC
jgi:hypothetical protein